MVGRLVSIKEGYLALGASLLAAGSDEGEGGSEANNSKCCTSVDIGVATLSLGMSLGEFDLTIFSVGISVGISIFIRIAFTIRQTDHATLVARLPSPVKFFGYALKTPIRISLGRQDSFDEAKCQAVILLSFAGHTCRLFFSPNTFW